MLFGLEKFLQDIEVNIELYDTLPDMVAARAASYWSGLLSDGLKQLYRPGRIQHLVYSRRPVFDFIPRRGGAGR